MSKAKKGGGKIVLFLFFFSSFLFFLRHLSIFLDFVRIISNFFTNFKFFCNFFHNLLLFSIFFRFCGFLQFLLICREYREKRTEDEVRRGVLLPWMVSKETQETNTVLSDKHLLV